MRQAKQNIYNETRTFEPKVQDRRRSQGQLDKIEMGILDREERLVVVDYKVAKISDDRAGTWEDLT